MRTVDRILDIAEDIANRMMHRRGPNKMLMAAGALAIVGAAAAVGLGAYKAMHANGDDQRQLDLG